MGDLEKINLFYIISIFLLKKKNIYKRREKI